MHFQLITCNERSPGGGGVLSSPKKSKLVRSGLRQSSEEAFLRYPDDCSNQSLHSFCHSP